VTGFRIATPDFDLLWGTPAADAPAVPRLAEQTAYPVVLRSRGGGRVALEHRDPGILRGLRTTDDGTLVWGTVDFGSQVGRSAFTVRAGGGETRFEVEVVPTKLDYEDDFRALVDDTQELAAGLALESLRATFHAGTPEPAARPGHAAWLTLLRHTAGELERALEEIARGPRGDVRRDPEPTRADRVRRPDAALRRAIARGAGTGAPLRLPGGVPVRERVEERRALPTLDTPEHRWLAAQLRALRARLARVQSAERAFPATARRARVLEEMAALDARAARWARLPPLAAAAADPPPAFASPRLLNAPGYREAHRAFALLALGVRVRAGPAELALRDLHLLYEQWCFLWLVRALSARLGPPTTPLAVADDDGLRLRIPRGEAVRWAGVSLAYEPRLEGAGMGLRQRPDFLLELPGARVVLDAKYRVDATPEHRARHAAPGPPADALNTLHRYRDALGVRHAVALFPGREAGRLAESARAHGIGAFPLLPGHDREAVAWLDALLGA
jgi:hypothetical protein